jgi:hypothetical protein
VAQKGRDEINVRKEMITSWRDQHGHIEQNGRDQRGGSIRAKEYEPRGIDRDNSSLKQGVVSAFGRLRGGAQSRLEETRGRAFGEIERGINVFKELSRDFFDIFGKKADQWFRVQREDERTAKNLRENAFKKMTSRERDLFETNFERELNRGRDFGREIKFFGL